MPKLTLQATVLGIEESWEPARPALEDLRTAAYRIIPGLRELPLEAQWAGLRPGSPQGIPYIGQHPEIAGLYVNTGHFRNGVVMGLASARLLADLVVERNPILEPGPYFPGGCEAIL